MSTYRNQNHALNKVGGAGTKQGIYEESSTPKHAIGEKVELAEAQKVWDEIEQGRWLGITFK